MSNDEIGEGAGEIRLVVRLRVGIAKVFDVRIGNAVVMFRLNLGRIWHVFDVNGEAFDPMRSRIGSRIIDCRRVMVKWTMRHFAAA